MTPCVICHVNGKLFQPSHDDRGMQIGDHLPRGISIPNSDYLCKYAPKLNSEVEQFPIGQFYIQCDELLDDKIQTDLMNDTSLSLFMKRLNIFSKKTLTSLKKRKAAMEKQEISRKLFIYATKNEQKPSLVSSEFDYTKYINRCGGDLSEFWNKNVLNKSDFEGSCDCFWITLDKGVFVIQLVSSETNDDEQLLQEIEQVWKGAHRCCLMFESIVSDLSDVQKRMNVTKVIALPKIESRRLDRLKQDALLCQRHRDLCMPKECLEDTKEFEEFFNKFSPLNKQMTDYQYTLLAGRCILLGSAIEFLPMATTARIKHFPLAKTDFCRQVSEKIDKVGQGLYMTPIQKEVIDGFSLERHDNKFRKLIINGHYGTGKSFTLLLGIQKLVHLIQQTRSDERNLIMFFSAKNERRQNSDGHLRDVYRNLDNLIKANPNIIFLLIEDKIHLRNKKDNGLIAQSETKVLEIDGGDRSALKTLNPFSLDGVYGLLDTLKKVFKDTAFTQDCTPARERGKSLHPSHLDFQTQCLYNFSGAVQDGKRSAKVEELNFYLFADEVDHEVINWKSIEKSSEFTKNVFWMGLNSETFNENKRIAKQQKDFTEVTLDCVLRNASLNAKFVNHVRQMVMKDKVDALNLPGIGHCVEGLMPKIWFAEKMENPSATSTPSDDKILVTSSNLSSIHLYEKLPNLVLEVIIEMFGLIEDRSFQDIVTEMEENLCVVSDEGIMKYLKSCFEIMDKGRSFQEKIHFMTPHSIIGREFDNILYINPSFHFKINSATNDIEESDLINVCSRPKNQLGIIDLGRQKEELNDNKNQNRLDVLSSIIDKECIVPQKLSMKVALHYLRSKKAQNSSIQFRPFNSVDGEVLINRFKRISEISRSIPPISQEGAYLPRLNFKPLDFTFNNAKGNLPKFC